jgi:predicted nucleic acid-binding protein
MTIGGFTFDTGALIALFDDRDQQFWKRVESLFATGATVTVPTIAITEWWRSGSDDEWRKKTKGFRIEALTESIARSAGEAIAAIHGAGAPDAIVMATAALRGDTVYTSDYEDLTHLREFFPTVRVMRVAADKRRNKRPKPRRK